MRAQIKKKVRVVITGLGAVTPIGNSVGTFWEALLAGENGVGLIDQFDTTRYESHVGATVKNFTQNDSAKNQLSLIGRATQYAIAASKEALDMAKVSLELRGGADVVVGTTMGEAQSIEAINRAWLSLGEDYVDENWIKKFPPDTIAVNVAKFIQSKGHAVVIPTACAAGNYAIGYASDLIRTGQSELVIAGGSDAISQIAYTGFNRLYAMSKSICRPFDKNRQGMVLGEGSGMLVLESLDHALARGAAIYAEVLGYGLSCDATHMTIPSISGVQAAMRKCLDEAALKTTDVDYISAHGTGTVANDKAEAQAIRSVFGEQTDKILISSIKSMIGHTMGAASALEAIACVKAIQTSQVPPTINYETPDEDCNIDCVPNISRTKRIKVALNNSFAFGGNNACVAFAGLG